MKKDVVCPHCGKPYSCFRNPAPTADVIIHEPGRGVVIIRRRHTPIGFALPGGFIDEGEQAEEAAIREMREETGLDVELTGLLGVYSRPKRDPRQHTLTVVYTGRARNPDAICGGDDAARAAFYPLDALPQPLVFDHAEILEHFRQALAGQRQVAAVQPLACHHLPDANAGMKKSVGAAGSDCASTCVSTGASTCVSTCVSAAVSAAPATPSAPAAPATPAGHEGEKC